MDMSEIDRSTAPSPAIAADAADGERWRDLVSAVGVPPPINVLLAAL